MRTLILLLAISISPTLLAHEIPEGTPLSPEATIFCMTEFATTTMQFGYRPENDRFTLAVVHHNGEKWMPVHKGLITINDLPTIEDRAQQLVKMGSVYTVDFEPENCRAIEEGELVCFRRTPTYLGELEVRSASFHNYTTTTRLYGQEFLTHVLSLGITVGNFGLSQAMDYHPNDCVMRGF